jgi:putative transport protein
MEKIMSMAWLANLFTKYHEMAVYLALGIAYLIGTMKFRGVGLGAVTGSLLGGILIGNFFYVAVAEQTKSILFFCFFLESDTPLALASFEV